MCFFSVSASCAAFSASLARVCEWHSASNNCALLEFRFEIILELFSSLSVLLMLLLQNTDRYLFMAYNQPNLSNNTTDKQRE